MLLLLFLSRATGYFGRSLFVAALFALHPLHVESVAWVAERKDVLSGFFWMLTLLAYSRYRAQPGTARYAQVMLALTLGLMAKPMLVTLPFVLLLLDYWPYNRFAATPGDSDRSVASGAVVPATLEKLPLLGLVALSSVVTLYAQWKADAISPISEVPLSARTANAVVSVMSYVVKTLYPRPLSVLYPFSFDLPAWKVAVAAALVIGVSALTLLLARSSPYLFVGWLWYLGTLVPVIGLVQVGSQAMADRYTYIPSIGLFLMIAWGVPPLFGQLRVRRHVLIGLGTVVLFVLALLTFLRVADWRDSVTIFSQSLSVTTDNLLAHHNLGVALARENRDEEALAQYLAALRIDPRFAEGYYSLGNLMLRAKDYEQALRLYGETTRLEPGHALAHNNAGVVLGMMGRRAEAVVELQHAVRLAPKSAGVHYNLAMALLREGRPAEAARHCSETLRIQPNHAGARRMLDYILQHDGTKR
jgi:tetratricopeptide (TPR) repeat protein